MKALGPSAAQVSDHAVLRYLERVCGIDVDDIRDKIAESCASGVALGAPSIKHLGGRFLNDNGTIVTTLHKKHLPKHHKLTELQSDD